MAYLQMSILVLLFRLTFSVNSTQNVRRVELVQWCKSLGSSQHVRTRLWEVCAAMIAVDQMGIANQIRTL